MAINKYVHGEHATIATLELHSLKELLVLRKAVQERKDYLEAVQDSLLSTRQTTIEYLTLGQILIRLPDPRLLTQQDIPS